MSTALPDRLYLDTLPSPIGDVLLVTDADGCLRALDFFDYEARMHKLLRLHYGKVSLERKTAPQEIKTLLTQYFASDLTALNSIRWQTGGTDFQRAVWQALTKIATGTTTTYGDIARALGTPSAARAVGLAMAPIQSALLVPCHRVIGANGNLTGYGGGLHRKQWLLEHEGAIAHQVTF